MNDDQRAAYDAVTQGDSIFLSGIAGAGKSFTLQHITRWARDTGRRFGLTASTGAAAVLIGGQTLHSFTGIGKGDAVKGTLVARALSRKDIVKRLEPLQLLVIDEISMIDAELFDKLSAVFSAIRGTPQTIPFGGVQLVLAGDFAQLPPVKGDFCFQSETWRDMRIKTHDLTQSMRQRDADFAAILRDVRWGVLTPDARAQLRKCAHRDWDHVRPTRLHSTNKAVDHINQAELNLLLESGAQYRTYATEYSPDSKDWADSGKIPKRVIIAVGAQVMLSANLDVQGGLVNGSRGVVEAVDSQGARVRFLRTSAHIGMHRLSNEENRALHVTYLPLRLSWATSIHKSQGQSLDCVEIDLRNMFLAGMGYVALSRVKSLDSLCLTGLGPNSFDCSPLVKEFYGV